MAVSSRSIRDSGSMLAGKLPNEIDQRYLTIEQTAMYLGMSVRNFQRIRHEIPVIRFGKRPMYDRADLDAFAQKKKTRPAVFED